MTGGHVASTGRALREASSAGTLGRRPPAAMGAAGERIRGRRTVTAEDDEFDPLAPGADTGEIVVRARAGLDEPPGWAGSGSAPGDAPDPAGDGIDALPELGADEEPAQLQLEEEADDGRGGPGREVAGDDLTPQGRYRASVTEDPEFVWRVPSPRFLTRSTGAEARPDTAGQAQTARSLVQALGHFGIEAQVVGKVSGPHITRYEIRLAPGVKMSKVANLKDDLAYALAATDIRILAPIPGKQAVGIEVPNARRRIVHLGDVIGAAPEDWSPLTVWLGKDIAGNAVGADLAKMPHLLVAGTTGAGKSACVNAMLSSILLRATPHEVRLVLVDPKQVELNHYESIPHLLTPVITSPRQAANALQNLVREMEQRYSIMQLARTRSLPDLNRVRESRGEPPLPYILCVIDELADLMMVAPADVEDSIIRLAQKARAVGMHLVLATQSPRVDVITGMIKANVPSRIAFAVSSQTDSRVILDQNGAESLLGQGDMLFSPVGSSRLQRIQGAFVDEPQILEMTEAWRKQGEPDLQEELLEEVEPEDGGDGGAEDPNDADSDPLLEEAISLVAQMGTASTSMLQRRLRLGYTRAGRLIDMLERRGIISGYEGSKPRQVLITEADVGRILTHLAEGSRGSSSGRPGGSAPAPAPAPADAPAPPPDEVEVGAESTRRRRTRPRHPRPTGSEQGVNDRPRGVRAGSLADEMDEIGSQLREARMRMRIDTGEVEVRTKIRAKYLRAMENEEWDLLPGEVYVRSFLRTYADFLGLDCGRCSTSSAAATRARPTTSCRRSRPWTRAPAPVERRVQIPRWVVVLAVLIVVAGVLYLVGKGNNSPNPGNSAPTTRRRPLTTAAATIAMPAAIMRSRTRGCRAP